MEREQTVITDTVSDIYSLKGGPSKNVIEDYPGNAGWVNTLSLLKKQQGRRNYLFTDDESRKRIQFFIIYLLMGIISLGMTVLNIFTAWSDLTKATLIFSLVSFANCVISLISERLEKLSIFIFTLEIMILFAYFAMNGEPEGFSILWSVLLPTCGMILYGKKWGTVVSGTEWCVLLFLFRTDAGRSLLRYDYTESFLQRFPLLYIALFAVGFLFESIRRSTQQELVRTRREFEYLYKHDSLTGLLNRYGLKAEIWKNIREENIKFSAFAIMDLDNFKKINDTYGHNNGDQVLKQTAAIIREQVGENGYVSRWGGEEFSVMFLDAEKAKEQCEEILKAVRTHKYIFAEEEVNISISIGLIEVPGGIVNDVHEIITRADENLYRSKSEGKNRLTSGVLKKYDIEL